MNEGVVPGGEDVGNTEDEVVSTDVLGAENSDDLWLRGGGIVSLFALLFGLCWSSGLGSSGFVVSLAVEEMVTID